MVSRAVARARNCERTMEARLVNFLSEFCLNDCRNPICHKRRRGIKPIALVSLSTRLGSQPQMGIDCRDILRTKPFRLQQGLQSKIPQGQCESSFVIFETLLFESCCPPTVDGFDCLSSSVVRTNRRITRSGRMMQRFDFHAGFRGSPPKKHP
jgi:hypothetical protein